MNLTSKLAPNLASVQAALGEAGLDGWLFYDHHHRDPLAATILGLDPKAHITRRWYYFIPAAGEPRKLAHRVEQNRLDALPGTKALYSSWQELHAGIADMMGGGHRIAMQYSPNNDIMYVSMVDAGTVEFIRSLGKEVVGSADLVSRFQAVLSEEQMATHGWRSGPSTDCWPRVGSRSGGVCGQPRALQPVTPNSSTWSG